MCHFWTLIPFPITATNRHFEKQGDATVTYDDPAAAAAAVEWFNNKVIIP